jgi:hypothetical protein
MKNLSILIILCVATATAVFSQALRKTEKINTDQVLLQFLNLFKPTSVKFQMTDIGLQTSKLNETVRDLL